MEEDKEETERIIKTEEAQEVIRNSIYFLRFRVHFNNLRVYALHQ